MMDCGQFQQRLATMAVDDPAFTLDEEMDTHVTNCATCREEAQKLRDAWLLLPAELGRVPVPDDLEDRVMKRIAAAQVTAPMTSPIVNFARFVLAASVLVCLSGITWWTLRPESATSPEAHARTRIQSAAEQLEKLQELERVFAKPKLRYVSLGSQHLGRDGYFVCDTVAHEAHFFGFKLPVKPFQFGLVWTLGSDGQVLSRGTIEFDQQRRVGVARIDLPEPLNDLAEIVVSVEANPHVETPSGEIVLRADFAEF